ncbi:hypothetical protein [Arthrobacter sp. MMS24-S77]
MSKAQLGMVLGFAGSHVENPGVAGSVGAVDVETELDEAALRCAAVAGAAVDCAAVVD